MSVEERENAETAAGSAPSQGPKRPNVAGVVLDRGALIVVWIAVIVVFGILRPDTFLSSANMQTILGSQATLVVVTLGLLIPLTAGDYDLSIASTLSLSAMVLTILNVRHGVPLGFAMLAGVGAGVLVGFVNGFFVVGIGVDSFIVTLGSSTFLAGIVLWISDSATISGVDDTLVNAVIGNRLLGIPLGFYYGLTVCILLWVLFEFTALGRRILFVGRGREVARLNGIRVKRVRWGALIASSTLAAVAGCVYAGTLGGANPTAGASFLLPAFAAAYLGATAIMPGRFNPWGSFAAVYFLITGITGLQLLGAPSYVQQLFYGGALIIAVSVSELVKRKRTAGTKPVVA
jgi:ribose transport system permease protein